VTLSLHDRPDPKKRPASKEAERPSSPVIPLGTQRGRYWDRTSDLFGVNEALYR
jgi:hypothetical protein